MARSKPSTETLDRNVLLFLGDTRVPLGKVTNGAGHNWVPGDKYSLLDAVKYGAQLDPRRDGEPSMVKLSICGHEVELGRTDAQDHWQPNADEFLEQLKKIEAKMALEFPSSALEYRAIAGLRAELVGQLKPAFVG